MFYSGITQDEVKEILNANQDPPPCLVTEFSPAVQSILRRTLDLKAPLAELGSDVVEVILQPDDCILIMSPHTTDLHTLHYPSREQALQDCAVTWLIWEPLGE